MTENKSIVVNTKKRIVIFSAFYPPHLGGVENYTKSLACELVSSGYDVSIVTTAEEGQFGIERQNSLTVYRMPSWLLLNNRLPIIKFNQKSCCIKNNIYEHGADFILINTRFYPMTLFGLTFAKKMNVPAIVLEHGSSYLTINNPIADRIIRIYEHVATFFVKRFHPRFFAVSEKAKTWLKEFNIECEGVLNNGVNIEEFKSLSTNRNFRDELNIQPDDKVIVFTGRLLPEKGIFVVVEAVNSINSKHDNKTHLCFAGDGIGLKKLQKLSNANIHVLGKLERGDISALLSQSDIFCFPSAYPEGFPTSILEAAAYGLGIIITDVGGAKELIPSNDYGCVIDTANVECVEKAIMTFLDNESYLKRVGEKVSERVKSRYSWKNTVAQLIGAIED